MAFNLVTPFGRRALTLLLVVGGSVSFSGCATITRGTHEALVIETEPSGAQVRLSNGFTGTSPTSFKISRKGDLMVAITKDGYEPVNVNVTTQVAGAGAAGMAGNVLLGGVIGAGVDAFSGGMLEHKPNPVKVTLVALKPVPAVAPATPTPVVPAVAPTPAASPTPAMVQAAPVEEAKPKPADGAETAMKPAVNESATEKKSGM